MVDFSKELISVDTEAARSLSDAETFVQFLPNQHSLVIDLIDYDEAPTDQGCADNFLFNDESRRESRTRGCRCGGDVVRHVKATLRNAGETNIPRVRATIELELRNSNRGVFILPAVEIVLNGPLPVGHSTVVSLPCGSITIPDRTNADVDFNFHIAATIQGGARGARVVDAHNSGLKIPPNPRFCEGSEFVPRRSEQARQLASCEVTDDEARQQPNNPSPSPPPGASVHVTSNNFFDTIDKSDAAGVQIMTTIHTVVKSLTNLYLSLVK